MDLKLRKLIANGALPKFSLGTQAVNSAMRGLDTNLLGNIAAGNNSTSIPSLTSGNGGVPVVTLSGSQEVKPMNALGNNSVAGFFEHSGSKQNPAVTAATKKPNATGQFLKNNAQGLANTAMSAINFADTIGGLSKNTMTSDEMMGSGGTVQQTSNGIGYTELRVDTNNIQKEIDAKASAATLTGMTSGAALGGSAGSLLGPVGGAVGTAVGGLIGGVLGFFGGKSAKREAERQKQIAINRTNAANTQNRELAYTIGLRNEFNRENRTDESQSLFHAEYGAEGYVNPYTGMTYKKHNVNTKYGKVKHEQNAWVSNEEIIGNKDDGHLYKVHGGENDTARAYLEPGDSVYSKKVINPETGNPVADDAPVYAAMGMLDRLDMNLNVGRMMKYTGRRKENVLPGYIGGTVGNVWNKIKSGFLNFDIGGMLPLINAYNIAAQRDARAEGLRAPKSYVANPYEQDALNELNKLHSDYYTVWAGNREAEARAKNTIAQSGGLGAGQRMLGYMGLANLTQRNNMQSLFEHLNRENALRAQAANAALLAGNQSATRLQQAYQWDEDMLAKAHAAQMNMFETSAYDKQNALGKFLENMWKKNQFDQTLSLYRDDLKIKKEEVQAMINQLGTKNTPVTLNGVAGNAAMLQVDPTTGGFVRTNPFSASQLLTQDTKKSIDNTNAILKAATNVYNNSINSAKKVAKPKITRRRTVKRGGKK